MDEQYGLRITEILEEQPELIASPEALAGRRIQRARARPQRGRASRTAASGCRGRSADGEAR